MTPERGFEVSEYKVRLRRAQALMAENGLAALLLTTEPEVRYFTGYLTRFWESPSRPWFLVVPCSGNPIAVIPSIGASLMARTWVSDIRTWSSPDLADDGVSLLAQTLREVAGGGIVGIPSGHETHLRMPLADFYRLKNDLEKTTLRDDANIMRSLRMVKSPVEIEKITHACTVAGHAFERVPEIVEEGQPLEEVFSRFQMLCLEEGADWVPYLAGGAGPDGYADGISPASARPLNYGDVLMLDTGLAWDGYFCDFDRNFAIEFASTEVHSAYARLIDATHAGFAAVRPGVTASDVFHAIDGIVTGGNGKPEAGRLGHGLGMQLTEWPSVIAEDHTVLEEGMVLTLEPGMKTKDGNMLVHEENIVVTENGARYISPTAGPDLPVIGVTT